jgi:hypothetical protein
LQQVVQEFTSAAAAVAVDVGDSWHQYVQVLYTLACYTFCLPWLMHGLAISYKAATRAARCSGQQQQQ